MVTRENEITCLYALRNGRRDQCSPFVVTDVRVLTFLLNTTENIIVRGVKPGKCGVEQARLLRGNASSRWPQCSQCHFTALVNGHRHNNYDDYG